MPSTAVDSLIHGSMFSTDEMREIFSDRAWAQKWLDTEAALATAQSELGVIPQDKADIINRYAKAELLDIASIGEFYKSSITIIPLLKAFKAVLPDRAGEFVHWGATSQDIVDTGIVLLQRDAYNVILRDMKLCRDYALDLSAKYRNTVMAGRTHVVHAIPITFGYKAAVWADELGRDIERLEEIAKRVFVGEMAGAVGTLASQPEHGLATQKRMFEILGLGVPVFIDTEHKTAHNKVTVTDGRWVATGSYNYNKNAESRNAENLLILDSPELAARYEENWRRHRAHSSAYTEKHAAGAASPKQQ